MEERKRPNGGWGIVKSITLDCGHTKSFTISPLRGDVVPCDECPSGWSRYKSGDPQRGNNTKTVDA
jgi:hypothetical protein